DPDPPDEVRDREAPGDRDVDAPDPDADVEERTARDAEHAEETERDRETEEPRARRPALEDDARYLVGDARVGVPRGDDRRRRRRGSRHVRRAPGSDSRPPRGTSSAAAC